MGAGEHFVYIVVPEERDSDYYTILYIECWMRILMGMMNALSFMQEHLVHKHNAIYQYVCILYVLDWAIWVQIKEI